MIKVIKVAICDDNVIIRNIVKEKCQSFFIAETFKVEYELFVSGEELVASSEIFDLVILDIKMPGINGFEAAEKIQIKNSKSKIILLTSHQEFMKHGYKVNAIRYLNKPVDDSEFNEALSSFVKDGTDKRKAIEIYIKKKKYYIFVSDIILIESLGDDLAIYTEGGTYICNNSLKVIFERLDNIDFCYTNRNYIVNLNYVKKIESNFIILSNSEKIKVSRRRIREFKKTFHEYIISNAANFFGDDTEC